MKMNNNTQTTMETMEEVEIIHCHSLANRLDWDRFLISVFFRKQRGRGTDIKKETRLTNTPFTVWLIVFTSNLFNIYIK